jgi:very-short-patch-repair endonuclease
MNNFKKIDKYCESCGKKLILKNTRDIKRKRFYSRECNASFLLKSLWKNEEYSKKMIDVNSIPNPKKGNNHLSNIPTILCTNCNKEIKKKIGKSGYVYCSRTCYDEFRKRNIVKREDSRKKIKLNCCLCGKEYEKHPSLARFSKYCSNRCHNIVNYINMPKKETSIERLLNDALKENNICFEKQIPILNTTIVDFFIKPNIVIYTDGDYWHNIPKIKNKDIFINNLLKKNNYLVLRYTENEIKHNILDVVEHLKNNLKLCQQNRSSKEN